MQLFLIVDFNIRPCDAYLQRFTLISSFRSPGRAACGCRISSLSDNVIARTFQLRIGRTRESCLDDVGLGSLRCKGDDQYPLKPR